MGDAFDALDALEKQNPQAASAAAQPAQSTSSSPAAASPSGSGDAFDALDAKEGKGTQFRGAEDVLAKQGIYTPAPSRPAFMSNLQQKGLLTGRDYTPSGEMPGSFEGKPENAFEGLDAVLAPVRAGADATSKYIQSQAQSIDPNEMQLRWGDKDGKIGKQLATAYKNVFAPAGEAGAEFLGGLYTTTNAGMMLGFGLIPTTTAVGAALHTAISGYFAGTMGVDAIQEAYEAYDQAMKGNIPEAVKSTIRTLLNTAFAVDAARSGEKSARGLSKLRQQRKAQGAAVEEGGTIAGPRTLIRPTTQKTAGVEAPIAATQQESAPIAARVAQRLTTPGAARDFQKSQTLPAAQKQITSALGQVMEDAISTHEAIAEGKSAPEPVTGTQQPSKFQTVDEAAQAGERAAKKTWQKGDAVDARETEEWNKKVEEAQRQVDEHNQNVEEYNANLSKGEEPMPLAKVEDIVGEKPKTLAELRGEWARAKANSRSSDAAVRQKAFDEEIPNAEKALDKWFKQHSDDISQDEYNSVKRLTFQHERMQDIANKLRRPFDTGTLTGNTLRGIEATFNNRGAKFGRPNAFKELLGEDGYQNWRNIAKILDPLKGPSQIERGLEAFSTALLGHMMPAGLAAKLGTEFILNRALFDPKWGSAFVDAFGRFKATGKIDPNSKRKIDDLMKFARMTDKELLAAGFTQEQIDRGEHLPGVGGGAPDTVADDANRFNEDRNRSRVRKVTPAAHPRGRDIAEAYDAMQHNPNDPEVKASYDSLKKDIDDQWEHAVQSGYKLEPWTGEGQPYSNSKQMSDDVNNNRHLSFFTGGDMPADHPLAEVDPKTGLTYNDKFRAIHDLFGHAAHSHEFGPKGEEAAYRTHAQMFSPESIPALTTETRGQNNWVNNGPHMQDAEGNVLTKGQKGYLSPADRPYAQQKAGILPKEFHGEGGIHQDVADYHNENGGFTFNPAKGEFVKGKGYSVAIPDAPSEIFSKEKLTADDVRKFMERPDVQEALKADPRNSIGGWNYKGKAQLEVSKLFDNREEAIAAGKKQNQTAIFDHANMEEIPTGGTAGDDARTLRVHHWSNVEGLTETDPTFMGTGVRGAERLRMANDPNFVKRTNFGVDGYREPAVQAQKFHYVADVDPTRYYDVENDPQGLWQKGWEQGGATGAERAIQEAGFAGYRVRNEVASFEKVPVRPFEEPKTEPEVEVLDQPSAVNASGESAASQEAVSRSASEKKQGITRVRVKRSGEEVPLFGPDAVDAKAGRGETIVKRYPDGREEIQDQGMGASYRRKDAFDSLDDLEKPKPDIRVGTKEGADADTKFFKQAQENLPNATLGEQLREAQRLKEAGGYGSANKGVTTAEYQAAVKRLNEQLGGLHSGIPLPLSELVTIGRYHLEAGARAFKDWSAAMTDAVGNKVKPYLKDLWDNIQKEPTQGVRPDSEIPTVRGMGERNPEVTAGWDAVQKAIAADPDRMTQGGKPHEGYARRLLNTLVENHPDLGVKLTDEDIQNPQQALEKVVNHWSDNLGWLHDMMPEAFREASKQWYDTAHKTALDWAGKYNMPVEKVAAVIAALSPKNAWDVNAGQAERMLDMYTNMRNHAWSDKMDDAARTIMKRSKSDYRKAINSIRGKTYDEVGGTGDPKVDNYLKGLWLKMLDEAHGGDTTPLFHPSGKVVGHVTMQWGMPEPMAKAVAILESDGTPETVHKLMGDGHKIRNFYNNIVSPNSIIDHTTIDTHAGNADMLIPRGSDDPEIAGMFGGKPANADAGLKGTYALHAEAYRRAAAKLGIRPRELQSITWEGIRSLMGDVKKTPELRKTVADIWNQHREGRLTIDEAREKIVEATGGFNKPEWMTDAEWEKANGTDFDFGMNKGDEDGAQISTQ